MATSIDTVLIKRIYIRKDSAANWVSENPILENGEFGVTTPGKLVKLGDGITPWVDLDPYTGPISEETDNILGLDSNGFFYVQTQIDDIASSSTKTYSSEKIDELTSKKLNIVNINLENTPLVPAQAGSNVYLRYTRTAGTNILINAASNYEEGMVFNIRAAGGDVTLMMTGVTLNLPPNGSNLIPNGGNISIVFISPTEADVFGYVELV